MSLESQREYVAMTKAGNEFSAHGDYWFYFYPEECRYEVRTPKAPFPQSTILVVDDGESLGLDWITELRSRIPQ